MSFLEAVDFREGERGERIKVIKVKGLIVTHHWRSESDKASWSRPVKAIGSGGACGKLKGKHSVPAGIYI